MRIALCLEYPIALQGGVSVLVGVLVKEFARRGHEIVLVSPDLPGTLQQSEFGHAVKEHIVWNPKETSPRTAKRLARELAEKSIELAHFHLGGNYGWGNRLLGRCPIVYLSKMRVPCFSTIHLVVNVLDGYCGPQKPLWFKLLLLPWAWLAKVQQLRHVRMEIAVSQHDLEKVQRWYWPWRRRYMQIYHSRLNNSEPPASDEARQNIILNVGHLAWRKGQATLAEAFGRIAARYPEWTLQLAGHDSGDGTSERVNEIRGQYKLGNRIALLGERLDAAELMRRAAIYVQPSTAEALGLALQEAMFHGSACIGARAGGIPEMVKDGQTGRLVEAGNPTELAGALEELILDPVRRKEWGAAGASFIRASGMTAAAMVDRHLTLYGSRTGQS